MERYKVALIADWYLPRIGGLELHMRDLARELNARGHEAHVICATRGKDEADGIKVHRLDVPLMPGLNTIWNRAAAERLEALLRAERYDIVHCQSVLSPLSHVGTYVARKLGIPSVLTEQSVLRGAPQVLFRSLNQVCPWASWPTVLTAVSSFVVEDVRAASGRDDVYVLNNGVNPRDWEVKRVREEGELRITSVLRFTKRKRPMDVVRAIPYINEKLGGRRTRFVLVGDGPERPRVEAEARRLGIFDQIEFTGVLNKAEIKDQLARSSLFVLPSIKEAHPRAVLEALAAGLPVVARTPNGVSDSVEHGREGLLARNFQELADSIARILLDDALRARMSDNARKRLHRFGWDHVITRHMELYRLAEERCQQRPGAAPQANAPRVASAGGASARSGNM